MLVYKNPKKLIRKPRKCSNCGKKENKYEYLLRCTGCYLVLYCSKRCQRKHWDFHKNSQCHPKYSYKHARFDWNENFFTRNIKYRQSIKYRRIIK